MKSLKTRDSLHNTMTVLGYKSKKLQQQGNFLSLKKKTKTKTEDS